MPGETLPPNPDAPDEEQLPYDLNSEPVTLDGKPWYPANFRHPISDEYYTLILGEEVLVSKKESAPESSQDS